MTEFAYQRIESWECEPMQENGRSQSALDKREWDGPCNEHLVGQLLQDLKGWGVDLESFQPKDLFETIRGRTLWCASFWHLVAWLVQGRCRISTCMRPECGSHSCPSG